MEKEIWKDILGYEGLYQASTTGRVRSMDREITRKNGVKQFYFGRILKSNLNHTDRPYVNLSKENKAKSYEIQRVMAITFLGERPKGYQVCHIDGNHRNNSINNLRYDTVSENSRDLYRVGRKNPKGVLDIDKVLKIRKFYSTGKYFQKDLAKMFNVSQTQISSIVRRESYSWLNDDGTIKKSKTEIKYKL